MVGVEIMMVVVALRPGLAMERKKSMQHGSQMAMPHSMILVNAYQAAQFPMAVSEGCLS